jgi:2-keto-3-deoxygluconate permease
MKTSRVALARNVRTMPGWHDALRRGWRDHPPLGWCDSWQPRFANAQFLSTAAPVLIPFFAFAHGTGIDLKAVWHAGLLELPLGLSVVAVTDTVLLTTDPFTGGHGVAGMAAGNAAAVPTIVPEANPAYAATAAPATAAVAASVVVAPIVVPFVTDGMAWQVGEKYGPRELSADDAGLTAATKS